jgi:AcrR family transcriptional regulator
MRKENIRAIKTKSSIKKQFLNLLKNKSLDLISVIDIARECKINRNTFYLHYKSINDLFFSLKQEIFSLFLSPLQTFTNLIL